MPHEKPTDPMLGVTPYDRAVSLLLALILVLGSVAAGFGVIWLSNQRWIAPADPPQVAVVEVPDVEGGGDAAGEPGAIPIGEGAEGPEAELSGGQDDVLSDAPSVENVMANVLREVGSAAEWSDELMTEADLGLALVSRRNPHGTSVRGSLGGVPGRDGGVPRQNRWEIVIDSGQTEEEYARQLDYFGFKLGAIVDKKLYQVTKLSARPPQKPIVEIGGDASGLYFAWRGGSRRQTDLRLLEKAGVPLTGDVIVLHLCSHDTEQLLARLELDYARANGRSEMQQIKKTRFVVKKVGAGYEFQITRQESVSAPPGT